MEQGFILIMLREMGANKYKVEKANYNDIVMDIDLSDDDDDLNGSQ